MGIIAVGQHVDLVTAEEAMVFHLLERLGLGSNSIPWDGDTTSSFDSEVLVVGPRDSLIGPGSHRSGSPHSLPADHSRRMGGAPRGHPRHYSCFKAIDELEGALKKIKEWVLMKAPLVYASQKSMDMTGALDLQVLEILVNVCAIVL